MPRLFVRRTARADIADAYGCMKRAGPVSGVSFYGACGLRLLRSREGPNRIQSHWMIFGSWCSGISLM